MILIADDHPLFREALRGAISRVLPDTEIREAADADGLYALVEALPDADLLLLDLNMPGVQGMSALVHLRAQYPQLPIVMVSAREEPALMRRVLDHGALGFIPKSTDSARIGEALLQVLDGECWAPANVLQAPRAADDEERETARRISDAYPAAISRLANGVHRAFEQANRLGAGRIRSHHQGAYDRHHAQTGGRQPHPGGASGRQTGG